MGSIRLRFLILTRHDLVWDGDSIFLLRTSEEEREHIKAGGLRKALITVDGLIHKLVWCLCFAPGVLVNACPRESECLSAKQSRQQVRSLYTNCLLMNTKDKEDKGIRLERMA